MVLLNEDSIIQCLQMEWIIQKKGLSPKVAKSHTFWFKPLSPFGLFDLTMFISVHLAR